MSKTASWKRMSSGRYVDLNNLRKEDVDLHDIEVSLNSTVRFNGHYSDRKPLTVAQHSLLCLNIHEILYPDDPDDKPYVFAHDFAETYIGDVATPVKKSMGKAWYDWAEPIEEVVERAFIPLAYPEVYERVKVCDRTALDIERRAMWDNQRGKDKWPTGHVNIGIMQDKLMLFEEVQSQGYIKIGKIFNDLC